MLILRPLSEGLLDARHLWSGEETIFVSKTSLPKEITWIPILIYKYPLVVREHVDPISRYTEFALINKEACANFCQSVNVLFIYLLIIIIIW